MYHMKIIFGLDISSPELNQLTEMFHGGRYICKDAAEITLDQTVPFVPTKEILDQYAKIIRDKYPNKKLKAEQVRFLRYDLFEEVPGTLTLARAKEIAFCALELIRQTREKAHHDPKDTDDWLFSELDMEKSEVTELFAPYGITPYLGSCYEDGQSPHDFATRYFAAHKEDAK